VIILRETLIEEKDEAGVGVERGIEIGIQGVEKDIVDIVIVMVVEAEAKAIRMVIGVEIGGKGKGKGKERRGEGGVEVEVFRHGNSVGLKLNQVMLRKEGKGVKRGRGRMLELIMRN